MLNIGKEAKKASFHTASATSSQKDRFLNDLAKRILKNIDGIVKANKKDLIQAVKNNFDDAFIDRLTLNKKNISAMADGLLQIEKLNDPISMYLSDLYTVSVNLAGLPAISVPSGFINELPVGMQLIGNYFQESLLMNVAHQYQKVTDWHQKIPQAYE